MFTCVASLLEGDHGSRGHNLHCPVVVPRHAVADPGGVDPDSIPESKYKTGSGSDHQEKPDLDPTREK